MEQVWDLLDEASEMPFGPPRTAILEEAVACADLAGEGPLAYQARLELVEACTFGGSGERLLPAFSWCLAWADAHPEEVDLHALLWQYKWAISQLPQFPTISRAQISSAMEDMALRFEHYGAGPSPVMKLRMTVAHAFGDIEQALEHLDAWRRHRVGNRVLADCHSCDVSEEVELLTAAQRDADALELAETALEKGMACQEEPHRMLGYLLMPLLQSDRSEDAAKIHHRGYDLIRNNPSFLASVGRHLDYLGAIDATDRARELIENHLRWLAASFEPRSRLTFLSGTVAALRSFEGCGQGGEDVLVPRAFDPEGAGLRPASELSAALVSQRDTLAAAFDARNGNSYVSGQARAAEQRAGAFAPKPA